MAEDLTAKWLKQMRLHKSYRGSVTAEVFSDPHYNGFGGQTYDVHPVGDAVLYEDKLLQIHARHRLIYQSDPTGPTKMTGIALQVFKSQTIEYDLVEDKFWINKVETKLSMRGTSQNFTNPTIITFPRCSQDNHADLSYCLYSFPDDSDKETDQIILFIEKGIFHVFSHSLGFHLSAILNFNFNAILHLCQHRAEKASPSLFGKYYVLAYDEYTRAGDGC